MKLAYVELCGFRGYRKPLRIDFADVFTIIDGRNGVGKSTICDAVEFVLTGTISKYLNATADGESVVDYFWWKGEGPAPQQHYVEVGFRDDDLVLPVRREQFTAFENGELSVLVDRLSDFAMGPKNPLSQLCNASIIRDEHIAALSLDLTESQRYALLRDAIGATDTDPWVERGKAVLAQTKKHREAVEAEVGHAAQEVATAGKRIDELRVAIAGEAPLNAAVVRLQSFAGSTATSDRIAEVARPALVERVRRLEELNNLADRWPQAQAAQEGLADLQAALLEADQAVVQTEGEFVEAAAAAETREDSKATSQRARDLLMLVTLGRRLGLDHGNCPLCEAQQDLAAYERGMAAAEEHAKQLDAQAVEQARREQSRQAVEARMNSAQAAAEARRNELAQSRRQVDEFERQLSVLGLSLSRGRAALDRQIRELELQIGQAQEDMRIVETLRGNTALERAISIEQSAKNAHARAEVRLGVARRSERQAQALYDAARRAAGETLNQRLDRVLPLMVELFHRLRPHPFWSDIEYKIRGDVRRFLKLQVGDQLNPQFIFSSGQRRATGLAFLLLVNLSLAWSRWKTILLDDPVQHIDDFRSVHLVEVMAQLVSAGRQIVCAVEDPALADLLCRRLPITGPHQGKRVTLGPDFEGALSIVEKRDLIPLIRGALVPEVYQVAG